MQKNDLWSGLVIIFISLYFLGASLAMPWKDTGFDWHGAPGLTPAVLAVLLGTTGGILLYRSRRNSKFYERLQAQMAHSPSPETEFEESEESAGKRLPEFLQSEKNRVGTVVALCAVYAFVLLGHLSYIVATTLFVGAFILIFRGAGWLKATVISIMTAVCVWLVFQQGFGVFLP